MTAPATPWMSVVEASRYLRCGSRLLYAAIDRGELRAARLGARRKIITRIEWCDQYAERMAAPQEISR